jgi:hypothetical protein
LAAAGDKRAMRHFRADSAPASQSPAAPRGHRERRRAQPSSKANGVKARTRSAIHLQIALFLYSSGLI